MRRARDAPATRVRDVTVDDAARTPDVYLHIVPARSVVVSRADRSSEYAERYSPGVRLRLEMGRYILAEDYVRAMHCARALTPRGRSRRSSGCDALLLPTLPIPAPQLGAATVDVDGMRGAGARRRCSA